MTASPVSSRRAKAPAVGLYLLFACAVVCGLVLAFLPRAIAPTELPALTLSAADVARVLRDDESRAASAPISEIAGEQRRMFLQFGQSEIAALENPQLASQRRQALHHVYERVVAAHGEAGALALREQALAEFERALDLQLPAARTKAVLGLFPNALEQHMATRDGEEIAPHFVMRTLYKVRWNRMNGLDIDWGFARVERIAYFGWLGLHATNLPLPQRRQALQKYAAAGGPHADEALGVLAFLDKDYPHAIEALTRAQALAPGLRLRNYINGALVAAALSGSQTGTQAAASLSGATRASVPHSP
jgi:hypothetical protein